MLWFIALQKLLFLRVAYSLSQFSPHIKGDNAYHEIQISSDKLENYLGFYDKAILQASNYLQIILKWPVLTLKILYF